MTVDMSRLDVPLPELERRIANEREALAPCADCGHAASALSEDGDAECTASGARMRKRAERSGVTEP